MQIEVIPGEMSSVFLSVSLCQVFAQCLAVVVRLLLCLFLLSVVFGIINITNMNAEHFFSLIVQKTLDNTDNRSNKNRHTDHNNKTSNKHPAKTNQ